MTTLQKQARALGDPTRYRIFRFLADADGPVGVAELTAHLGFNHNAIRQHLAKLVAAEMVTEATSAATGPGRPRLVYAIDAAVDSRWGVTGPYERLSRLLAEIVSTGDTPVEVGRRAARHYPVTPSPPEASIDDLTKAMAREGFDPEIRRRGNRIDIVLRSCPFESTAVADPETVCGLHLGLAEGLAADSGEVVVDELIAKDPRRAGCRLRLHLDPSDTATPTVA